MAISRRALAAFGFSLVVIGFAATGAAFFLVVAGITWTDESRLFIPWSNTVPIGIAAFLFILLVSPSKAE